jgi:hypothetical protein
MVHSRSRTSIPVFTIEGELGSHSCEAESAVADEPLPLKLSKWVSRAITALISAVRRVSS